MSNSVYLSNLVHQVLEEESPVNGGNTKTVTFYAGNAKINLETEYYDGQPHNTKVTKKDEVLCCISGTKTHNFKKN